MSTYGAAAAWRPTVVSTTSHDLRLTRRGRLARSLALAGLLALLDVSLMDTLGGGRALADDPVAPRVVTTQTVTVAQGDSLWAIAQRTSPQSDPREVVTAIRELNGMRSNVIHPGQVLLIPSAG